MDTFGTLVIFIIKRASDQEHRLEMQKKGKKVSFSSKRKEYGSGPGSNSELVTVADEPVEKNDSSDDNSDVGGFLGEGFKGKTGRGPHRNVTDTPKPSIFTPEPSIASLPIHLLPILYFSFGPADAKGNIYGGMKRTLIILIILQCLSFYGIALTVNMKRSRWKLKQKTKNVNSKKITESRKNTHISIDSGDILGILFALFISILASVPIYIVLILFGAPISSYTSLTFLLALHISIIATFPLLCTYRVASSDFHYCWVNLLTFQVDKFYKNQIYMMAVGAMVGCWLGVIPIPLDWDRPWQAWPITLLVGTYVGATVGNLIGYFAGRFL